MYFKSYCLGARTSAPYEAEILPLLGCSPSLCPAEPDLLFALTGLDVPSQQLTAAQCQSVSQTKTPCNSRGSLETLLGSWSSAES